MAELILVRPHGEKISRRQCQRSNVQPQHPRTAIESCHCERSEAISHCCTEIAAHPAGARNDGKNRVVAKSIAVLGYVVVGAFRLWWSDCVVLEVRICQLHNLQISKERRVRCQSGLAASSYRIC